LEFNMRTSTLVAAATASVVGLSATASLVAGDVAIVGFQASGAVSDSIAFAALTDLAAGTVIYFTDNGWTGTAFRGVSATDSDGNENLMKFTVGAGGLAAGTVVSSRSTNATYGQWTLSGLVGTGTSAYQQLSLSSTGEQITAFISTNATNPMFSDFTSLYNFDNTGAYENATTSGTGSLAPGLVGGTSAVLLSGGQNYAVFNFSAFSGAADQATWLARIGNAANWTTGTQTTDMADGSFLVPAPGAVALVGLAGLIARRRK
jgi:hypothetical protein